MSAYHTFEGYIHQHSAKAVYFQSHYWEIGIWVPKSQSIIEEDGEGHVVQIKNWLCKKRSIDEFCHKTEEELIDDWTRAQNG